MWWLLKEPFPCNLQGLLYLLGATAAASANLLRLLRQKNGLDVRQHTALSDRHARQQLVQLLVVPDRQLQVARDDPRLLVVASSVSGQLKHLGRQVFHHGCQGHGSTGAPSLRVVPLPQQTVDSTHGELQTGSRRTALRLSLHFPSLSTSGHLQRFFLSSLLLANQRLDFSLSHTHHDKNRRPNTRL